MGFGWLEPGINASGLELTKEEKENIPLSASEHGIPQGEETGSYSSLCSSWEDSDNLQFTPVPPANKATTDLPGRPKGWTYHSQDKNRTKTIWVSSAGSPTWATLEGFPVLPVPQ